MKNGNKKIIEKSSKQKSVHITLDEDKGFFRLKSLSQDDIKHLKYKRYQEFEAKSITSDKIEKYLIRPRFNESLQHCFLTYDIADYLRKFTDKVWLYQTKRPDIVFKMNDKVYAIEVETGKAIIHHRKLLMKKVDSLNKNYDKNWFFVVTDRKLGSKYSKLGSTTDKRYVKSRIDKIVKGSKKL